MLPHCLHVFLICDVARDAVGFIRFLISLQSFKVCTSFTTLSPQVGKLQKGMKHLRKRLTSPEAHEPPRASPGNWRAGRELPPPPPPDEDAPPADTPANEEAEEERRGRQIVTQKNVRPPKVRNVLKLNKLSSWCYLNVPGR